MSYLSATTDKDTLKVFLCERIDAVNAPEVERELNEIVGADSASQIVLDAAELQYIASAGLRILLMLRKKHDRIRVINACSDVYDVFTVTAMDQMIPIEKAFRQISIENCPLIGKGACGTVYKLDDERIVKVFVKDYPYDKIVKERNNSRNAFTHGVDTAIPFDIVRVGEDYGLIYEILNADTLKSLMVKDHDKLEYYIGLYAEYVRHMHSVSYDGYCYPEMKQVWLNKIDTDKLVNETLSGEEKSAAKKLISQLPDRMTFVHGDVNFGNLMIDNGRVVLIDMEDAVLGHPIFDVAFTYYLIKLVPDFLTPEWCDAVTGFSKEENALMWNTFCKIYFGCNSAEDRAVYEAALRPYGLIKLLEVFPMFYSVFGTEEMAPLFKSVEEKYKKELLDYAEKGTNPLPF